MSSCGYALHSVCPQLSFFFICNDQIFVKDHVTYRVSLLPTASLSANFSWSVLEGMIFRSMRSALCGRLLRNRARLSLRATLADHAETDDQKLIEKFVENPDFFRLFVIVI